MPTSGSSRMSQATAYWARTSSAGRSGEDTSYRGRFVYPGDRYGVDVERLAIGPQFNPEVGFVRRGNVAISSASGRFSPRFRQGGLVRKLTWQADLDYITDAAGDVVEDRTVSGLFGVEFNSGETMTVTATSSTSACRSISLSRRASWCPRAGIGTTP